MVITSFTCVCVCVKVYIAPSLEKFKTTTRLTLGRQKKKKFFFFQTFLNSQLHNATEEGRRH